MNDKLSPCSLVENTLQGGFDKKTMHPKVEKISLHIDFNGCNNIITRTKNLVKPFE